MDDFPTAEAVLPIPVASDALPPSFGPVPRSTAPSLSLPTGGGMKVASKPGRYETGVDTRPLTPPSSSHNLQLVFDSSKIYDNHPRKYRLLLDTDKDSSGSSKNCFQSATSSTDVATTKPSLPSVSVEDGRVVAMGTTSSGPAASPNPTPDAATALLPPPTKTVAARGAPFTLSEAVSSLAVKKEPGESRYVPQQFLQTFKAATTLKPPSDKNRATSSSAPSSVHKSNAPIPKICVPERGETPAGCAVVQPGPRRLFGFGPYYRPLPETICATTGRRQSSPTLQVPSGLSEAVDREGVTGAEYSGSRRASTAVDSTDGGATGVGGRKPPTPAELNVWLGGSF